MRLLMPTSIRRRTLCFLCPLLPMSLNQLYCGRFCAAERRGIPRVRTALCRGGIYGQQDGWMTVLVDRHIRASLPFLCELGPPNYGSPAPTAMEPSDHWQEPLTMRGVIRALWGGLLRKTAEFGLPTLGSGTCHADALDGLPLRSRSATVPAWAVASAWWRHAGA